MKYDLIKRYNAGTHFVFPIKNEKNNMQKVIIVPEFRSYKINDVVVLNFSDSAHTKGKSALNSIYMADFVKFNEKLTIGLFTMQQSTRLLRMVYMHKFQIKRYKNSRW